jgi:hypothetical protein
MSPTTLSFNWLSKGKPSRLLVESWKVANEESQWFSRSMDYMLEREAQPLSFHIAAAPPIGPFL